MNNDNPIAAPRECSCGMCIAVSKFYAYRGFLRATARSA